MLNRFFILLINVLAIIIITSTVTSCDSEPPKLMKASIQFDSSEVRDNHIALMRKNHMDLLKHKRDETMYKGIRTDQNSINACINCHVPTSYNGEVLRHTDPKHFCSSCHNYVATKLDCFDCHVDHPIKKEISLDAVDFSVESAASILNTSHESLDKLDSLNRLELFELAFKYASDENKQEHSKSGGVSFKSPINKDLHDISLINNKQNIDEDSESKRISNNTKTMIYEEKLINKLNKLNKLKATNE